MLFRSAGRTVLPSGGPNLGKKVPRVSACSRRNPPHASFPKPKSLNMDVKITPRQLAPSVGTQRVGSTIPAASSTIKFRYAEMPFGLVNSSSTRDSSPKRHSSSADFDSIYFDSEAATNSITFGSFDFTPHSSMSKIGRASCRERVCLYV